MSNETLSPLIRPSSHVATAKQKPIQGNQKGQIQTGRSESVLPEEMKVARESSATLEPLVTAT
jgi:hypothetical protein